MTKIAIGMGSKTILMVGELNLANAKNLVGSTVVLDTLCGNEKANHLIESVSQNRETRDIMAVVIPRDRKDGSKHGKHARIVTKS